MSATQIEVTPVWANYLDLQADVKPWLQFDDIPDASVDARLQRVVNMACQWVQNYLGRPIAPTKFFRRFSGASGFNGAYISLPYYPVLSIEKVVEYRGISGPHVLLEQTPENQQGNQEVFQMDYIRGFVTRTFMGLVQRPWFPGSKNIEITWTAGYEPVPEDINIATLELIAHWWRNTQQTSASTPAPAGYEYDQENPAGGMWAGVPHRITGLLSPYKQVGIG
jgi:hypothetical protein